MKLSDADIDKLLTDLSSSNNETRERAERFYNENKTTILPQLEKVLERLVAIERRHPVLGKSIAYFALFNIPFCWFCSVMSLRQAEYSLVFMLGMFVPLIWLILLYEHSRSSYPPREQYALLKMIERLDDARFIGFLMELMFRENTRIKTIAAPILYKQLCLLRPYDASLLKPKYRTYLRRRLLIHGTSIYEDFNATRAISILKAFEQIDYKRALSEVRSVAATGATEEVRKAAQECQNILEHSQKAETMQNTLLRASENAGGKDELLRAANAQSDTHSETLLRIPNEE